MARLASRAVNRRYSSVYCLVVSSNPGRFAVGSASGRDLTCGQEVSLLLGGQWIDGCVEHALGLYPITQGGGYFFVADDGGRCGLCVGMQVRLIG